MTTKKKSTGRYYISDIKTGKKYCVEPIGKPRTEFGDSLHEKCDGSITEAESIITEANGFTNIGYAQNPMDYIEQLEKKNKGA
jgi:hypothetical protein